MEQQYLLGYFTIEQDSRFLAVLQLKHSLFSEIALSEIGLLAFLFFAPPVAGAYLNWEEYPDRSG